MKSLGMFVTAFAGGALSAAIAIAMPAPQTWLLGPIEPSPLRPPPAAAAPSDPRPVATSRHADDPVRSAFGDRAAGFSKMVDRYARLNGVPFALALAVIEVESGFRPRVRGRAGEIGLMQIKPATARMMGFRGPSSRLFDPETNIRFGMKYLGGAWRKGGETTCGAILKYNAGHGARRMNRVSAAYCEKVKRILRARR